MRLIFATVVACAGVQAAQAQTSTFTFQGHLGDEGLPASGLYDLRFELFDAATNGTSLGAITNETTVVDAGRFSAHLDFGAAIFDGSDRWLEVGAVTNGGGGFTTLSPRQQISSTPYAVRAGNAAHADALSGTLNAAQLTGTISSNHVAPGTITAGMIAAGAVDSNHLAVGAVTPAALADDAVSVEKIGGTSRWYRRDRILNPFPGEGDRFARGIAGVGTDKVAIGAYLDDASGSDAGAAYLFDVEGTLLTTFTNPVPGNSDWFGLSVAEVGDGRVLIGARGADLGGANWGGAFLFDQDGTLANSITNPGASGADFFGYDVAPVGSDRMLIGSYGDDTGFSSSGAAYLFDTDGTLLVTYTNPTAAVADFFGLSVAAVGEQMVLIGAYGDDAGATNSGAAHLFTTDGTLLHSFTNPDPAEDDYFGFAVAGVGTDQVLIGAHGDDALGAGNGIAYLFSTNGTLLHTFANPDPGNGDGFGYGVAVLDSDAVLISASEDDAGGVDSGTAYLFGTDGTLLHTFRNPASEAGARFGRKIAVLGGGQVAVGAYRDNQGAEDSGTAYLFQLGKHVEGLIAAEVDSLADGVVTGATIADGAVTGSKVQDGTVSAGKIAQTVYTFGSSAVSHPVPGDSIGMGDAVASVGADTLLVGAPQFSAPVGASGAALLYDAHGTLLNTITNPAPSSNDRFGHAVSAVGQDMVLVGAYGDDTGAFDAGAAYLHTTDGTLLATYTNPAPANADRFGYAVASAGGDRVVIGAYLDDPAGVTNSGTAYLYSTNGTLLTTIANPTPAKDDRFGLAMAGVGEDMVIIGAYLDDTAAANSGAAYLYDSDGNLLRTFTHPDSAVSDYFGASVAGIGADKVLIGAYLDDLLPGNANAGAAYLFSTNGTLLARIWNPAPGFAAKFGYALTGVGQNRLLIGTREDDLLADRSGAAYLFDLEGTLLTTITNPSPGTADFFGDAVAALGDHRIAVGAPGDKPPGGGSGSTFLFDLGSYHEGMVAEAVRAAGIDTRSIADGAVTSDKISGPLSLTDSSNVFVGSFLGRDDSSADPAHTWQEDTDTGLFRPGSDTLGFAAGGTERLRITSSGQVGIRTTSPEADLHVRGTDATGRMTVTPDVSDSNAQLLLSENQTASIGFIMRYQGDNGKNPLYFIPLTNDVEMPPVMTLQRFGNVGIGTGSPVSALQVEGTVTATGFAGQGSGLTGLPNGHALDAPDGSPANALSVDTAGQVGVGTTSPAAQLDVSGDVRASSFEWASPQAFVHQISASGFVPDTHNEGYDRGSGLISPASGDTFLQFHAPLHLPQGATVTKLVGVFFDRDTDDFTDIDLRLRFFSTASLSSSVMAEILNEDTVGFSAGRYEIQDTSIANAVVDNTTRAYSLDLAFSVTSATQDTRFYGVRIEYTLDTLQP